MSTLNSPLLRYDAAFMSARVVGKTGYTKQELSALLPRLTKARNTLLNLAENGQQGWLFLPDDRVMVKRIRALVEKKKHLKTCVVIGIGGSDLGTRAFAKALLRKDGEKGMRLRFIGANTDPQEIEVLLQDLNFSETLLTVISKSGDTLETMATFLVLRERMEQSLGKERAAAQIVAITDEHHGTLRELAMQEGYDTLPVPANVGGRFSVLSDVGLFPLACAGIEIEKILLGARKERDAFLQESIGRTGPGLFAALHYLALTERNQPLHIFMPYAEALREFGFWYRQLWAESLGKSIDREGKRVKHAPTPIAALGATDQHSQIQLYNEGPEDKVVTFLEVEHFDSKLTVPRSARTVPAWRSWAGKKFEELIHIEREATATALMRHGRPSGTLFLSRISPESLGALVLFFEIATGLMGEFMNIDAYNQPGVEEGKREMRRLLSGEGK